MIGTVIFMVICLWAFSLSFGMLIAHLTWTPPASKESK